MVKMSREIKRPVREGARKARQVEGVRELPRRKRRAHSMVMRKQTTASPAKIPMNTARIKKKRSSLKESCAVMRRRSESAAETKEPAGVREECRDVSGILTFRPREACWPRREERNPLELARHRGIATVFRWRWKIQRAVRSDRVVG